MKRLQQVSETVAGRLDEPRLSVAPLIDICFLLLIYFMVTTTITPAERDLTKQVPGTLQSGTPTRSQTVRIHVRGDGMIVMNPGPHELYVAVNAQDRELVALVRHLEMMMIGGSNLPPVMVRVDGEAEHQRVVDVMSILEKVGWDRVAFEDEEDQ